jgi:RHS repeat-associated protein
MRLVFRDGRGTTRPARRQLSHQLLRQRTVGTLIPRWEDEGQRWHRSWSVTACIGNRTIPDWSNHYYYWARCLHAQLGRFCNRDPIGYRAGVNSMEYVSDGPTSGTEPTGLLPPDGNNWQSLIDKPKQTLPVRRPPTPSGAWRVCCRNVRGNWFERWARHCDLRTRPCDQDSRDEYSEEYSVWRSTDANRQLDDGTPCSCATLDQIRACVGRHPQSADPRGTGNGINNNCQTAALLAIGACCLNSNWRPNWYAGNPRGKCLREIAVGYPPQFRCVEWELPDWINDPTEEPLAEER